MSPRQSFLSFFCFLVNQPNYLLLGKAEELRHCINLITSCKDLLLQRCQTVVNPLIHDLLTFMTAGMRAFYEIIDHKTQTALLRCPR